LLLPPGARMIATRIIVARAFTIRSALKVRSTPVGRGVAIAGQLLLASKRKGIQDIINHD
jgi:hypothetical protein